jgi:hypothetical protein
LWDDIAACRRRACRTDRLSAIAVPACNAPWVTRAHDRAGPRRRKKYKGIGIANLVPD